jgi:hypothetical protein
MALANATKVATREGPFASGHGYQEEIELSGLTAGLTANVPHDGPTATAADEISFMIKTKPTDGSIVQLLQATTDTTNNELDLLFSVPAGGSMDGCVLKVYAKWRDAARQDGQSISQDNG